MYNTNFKVKYYDIEQELIQKSNAVNTEAGADHFNVYSLEDIQNVCDKLYKDELISVFYAEDIFDDKIDIGIKDIITKMLENEDFKTLLDSLKSQLNIDDLFYDKKVIDYSINIDLITNLTLFSKAYFHLTHKCICQYINNGQIDIHLLVEMTKIVIVKD
jgi:hypothetical protein